MGRRDAVPEAAISGNDVNASSSTVGGGGSNFVAEPIPCVPELELAHPAFLQVRTRLLLGCPALTELLRQILHAIASTAGGALSTWASLLPTVVAVLTLQYRASVMLEGLPASERRLHVLSVPNGPYTSYAWSKHREHDYEELEGGRPEPLGHHVARIHVA